MSNAANKAESEQLKTEGNSLYASKKYAEACALYERASKLDPDNFLLYNNIAAAKLALRRYDEAIYYARKALSISNNFKSHSRIASALIAQNKTVEARKELHIALSMDATNEQVLSQIAALDVKEQLSQTALNARYGLPSSIGGEFVSADTGRVGLLLSFATVLLGVVCVLGIFFRLAITGLVWKAELACCMANQVLIMLARGIIQLRPLQIGTLSHWKRYHPTMVFLLCVALILFAPHYLVGTFVAMYAALDIASRKTETLVLLGPLASTLAPRIQQLEDNQTAIRLSTASFEAFTIISCILPSGNYVLPFVYGMYIRYRYQRDIFVQFGFTSLKQGVEKITRSTYMPPAVDRLFQKFCDTLASYAMS